ncbi:hypothetical protein DC31_06510, partial [Microbacterium sp. CH12i]
MAAQKLRRGLPRVAGGDAWPPASEVEVADAAASDAVAEAPPIVEAAPNAEPASAVAGAPAPAAEQQAVPAATTQSRTAALRRGLPRTPGGEPWPPAGAAAAVAASEPVEAPSAPVLAAATQSASTPTAATKEARPSARSESAIAPAVESVSGSALRRGLPRSPGGEPWRPRV